uniref:Uncharacterized protein n=1 Tax=Caenorhabditis japonica TaxID=281687 RepID=A0A8R1IRM1_CAEJA
ITDHFAHRVSRNCPNLSYFRISDCPLVTTLTALQFIESASYRSSDKLDMHMDNTEFDAEKLLFFIKNPCFESSYSNWSLQQVLVPIAYDKPAYLALHQSRKCVLIFV